MKVSNHLLRTAMNNAIAELASVKKDRHRDSHVHVSLCWLKAFRDAFKSQGVELVVADGRGIETLEVDDG